MSSNYDTYSLGDFKLKNGGMIPNASIAYKTFGESTNPAVIYPSWYSGLVSKLRHKSLVETPETHSGRSVLLTCFPEAFMLT